MGYFQSDVGFVRSGSGSVGDVRPTTSSGLQEETRARAR